MSRFFGGTRQLGMVVRDADATMQTLTETLGFGPFVCLREIPFENYRYRGESGPTPVVTLCFGQSGDLQIEIIQQHNDVPSAYREFLDSGLEGCQHISTWFDNHAEYDRAYATAIANGLTLVQEAEGEAEGDKVRFAYFETGLPGGLMLELSEALLPAVKNLPNGVKAMAVDWDGSDPVR